ncbi:ELMO domain-containing protein 2-like [Amphiura filiformis]|uniref:ELMO domain-containing protein 2-like n=1 Tax=Amphiura filiformis TaxID=82378 RepID=UPI003B210FDD
MLYSICLYLYFSWVHHMLKWLLHKLTGASELQRICAAKDFGARRAHRLENSLMHSRLGALKRVLAEDDINIEDSVHNIMAVKGIDPDENPQFTKDLRCCLQQICGYKQLIKELEQIRKQPYETKNNEHEEILLKLWNLLMPDTKLESRITKQWGDIGFQGDDPSTDFRGMGMLGLHNLVYFAEEHSTAARHVLSRSNHPKIGYSYAVVGINLTSMAYTFLSNGSLKFHFYNKVKGKPSVEHFHQVYSYLFFEFDKFWVAEKPRDVMDFSRIRDKFQEQLTVKLQDMDTVLETDFSVSK